MLDCNRKYEGLNGVIWRAPFPMRRIICDHKLLTFIQRIYRIANIRAQVLNGRVLKKPALDNSITIGVFYDALLY